MSLSRLERLLKETQPIHQTQPHLVLTLQGGIQSGTGEDSVCGRTAGKVASWEGWGQLLWVTAKSDGLVSSVDTKRCVVKSLLSLELCYSKHPLPAEVLGVFYSQGRWEGKKINISTKTNWENQNPENSTRETQMWLSPFRLCEACVWLLETCAREWVAQLTNTASLESEKE